MNKIWEMMLFNFRVAQKNACQRWWEQQLRGAKEKKNTTTPRNFFIFIKRTNLIRKNADKRSLRSFPLVLTTTESAEKEKNRKKSFFASEKLASCHQCHSNVGCLAFLSSSIHDAFTKGMFAFHFILIFSLSSSSLVVITKKASRNNTRNWA